MSTFGIGKEMEGLCSIWRHAKKHLMLYGDYVRLVLAEKMIVLFSGLMLTFVLIGLGLMTLFYIGECCVQLLALITGSLAIAHAIVAAGFVCIGLIIYLMRKRLIVVPLTKFISKLILEKTTT